MAGPRIVLLHAYGPSIPPIVEAFAAGWPQAEALNMLDETLYRDVGADGSIPPSMPGRLAGLFHHCEASGAKGVVFTGSTFGPAVDQARAGVGIPVLKADEAMAEAGVAAGRRILVVCTAKRAIPVIRGNVEAAVAAAGAAREIGDLWVPGAKDANDAGRAEEHDRAIAGAVADAAAAWDVILLGQISMVPALRHIPAALQPRVLTSPAASVAKMRTLIGGG